MLLAINVWVSRPPLPSTRRTGAKRYRLGKHCVGVVGAFCPRSGTDLPATSSRLDALRRQLDCALPLPTVFRLSASGMDDVQISSLSENSFVETL